MSGLLGKVVRIDSEGAAPSLASLPEVASQVASQWKTSRASTVKPGECRLLFPAQSHPIAGVASGEQPRAPQTGPDSLPPKNVFLRNERLEWTRLAAAKGVRALRELGKINGEKQVIEVDSFSSSHAAAVGAILGLWNVNHFKTRGPMPGWDLPLDKQGGRHISIAPMKGLASQDEKNSLRDEDDDLCSTGTPLSWYTGEVYAHAQNWSRELQEVPANLMSPTIFSERVVNAFKNVPHTQVMIRDAKWAREQNMNLFLSVAQGSEQPCKFVEIHYHGAPEHHSAPLALVGKGITFDTGGISLKPSAGMDLMRADMGGAAAVVASTLAIAQLGLPINVVTVAPLTENMPSGRATKPGDIFQARNGLTVQVDNTDAEGRLVLADALSYVSETFSPHTVIDVATLTGACVMALGDVYSGVFTESDSLWHQLKTASEAEHDLCWRMPLTDMYLPQISKLNADLVNTGGRPAGACTAAIFLKQFVHGLEDRTKGEEQCVQYAHIDIAGSMEAASNTLNDYQAKGLTGRPVRALVEFARRLAYTS